MMSKKMRRRNSRKKRRRSRLALKAAIFLLKQMSR